MFIAHLPSGYRVHLNECRPHPKSLSQSGRGTGKQLLAPSQVFHALNYDMLLVDFRGVGGSSGNTTTVGVREAEDVAIAVNYTRSLDLKRPIVLYGVSMGTAAILKAVAQKKVNPDAIVLELPFTRLLDAVRSRLKRDRWTTESEIDRIFNNFQGIKQKVVFPKAGHDLLVTADRKLWVQSIDRFLEQIENS